MNKCIHSIISSYLAFDPVASPDKTLVRDGNYTVDFIRHRMTFRMRCLSRKLQLTGLCALLRLAGAARHAAKVSIFVGLIIYFPAPRWPDCSCCNVKTAPIALHAFNCWSQQHGHLHLPKLMLQYGGCRLVKTLVLLLMQIMMAHEMWTKLGSSKYDYNFTFATPSTASLYDLMTREEQRTLKVHLSILQGNLRNSYSGVSCRRPAGQ